MHLVGLIYLNVRRCTDLQTLNLKTKLQFTKQVEILKNVENQIRISLIHLTELSRCLLGTLRKTMEDINQDTR